MTSRTSLPANQLSWGRIAKRIRVPLGFAFAVLFLLLAQPSFTSLALSLLLVVPGLLLRGYASGYVKKNAELTTTGPYSWTRNPLYLGSILIAFGFAAGSRSLLLVALLACLFAVIYIPVIRGEEQYLRSHFPGFDTYARRVPRLIPWKIPSRSVDTHTGKFAPELYRKHREYNATIGTLVLYFALLLRMVIVHRMAAHGL